MRERFDVLFYLNDDENDGDDMMICFDNYDEAKAFYDSYQCKRYTDYASLEKVMVDDNGREIRNEEDKIVPTFLEHKFPPKDDEKTFKLTMEMIEKWNKKK